MLDIQYIRDNPDVVKQKSQQKGYKVDIAKLLKLDEERRNLLVDIEALRAARNEHAAALKAGKPTEAQIEHGKELKERLLVLEQKLDPIEHDFLQLLKAVPNMPTDDVPVGASEDDNKIVKTVGKLPQTDFKPLSDAELGLKNDTIDKERAAKVAGARFAYLKGDVVRLQFAIIQFVLTTLGDQTFIESLINEHKLNLDPTPFTPILPPALIKTKPYEASARLDAEEVTYKLAEDELWLNASAEHSLCTMYMDEVFEEAQLPIRYIGYATSFRREAGSYGKDTEGIFRMHQFDKLEMEVFSTPETGYDEHKLLVAIQEYLVQQLELPYQLIQKCTADIGKPNAQGIDINIWMPAQAAYRETHSADYITDYQARRLRTRVKRKSGAMDFVHTNDATAFALGRTLKAILENYQTKEGAVVVPKALQPFMGGKEQV
ncbi:MAG TPA: serine--tRNA ligase [Candidatus Saccharibacteria bacterium]|nr:serine--tRNA ligase [Candidatus Saccharibacteria bacterium]